MGGRIRFSLYIVVLFFLATFGVKNSQPVQLKYYFNLLNVEIPLYLLIFILILIGIAVGLLLGFFSNLNQKKMLKTLERENRELKSKLPDKE